MTAASYFECFPEEKLIPGVTTAYVTGALAAYKVCCGLVKKMRVQYMILATSMMYFHRFYFAESRATTSEALSAVSGRSAIVSSGGGNGMGNATANTPSKKALVDGDAARVVTPPPSLGGGGPIPGRTFEAYHPVLVVVAAFFLALKSECVHRPLHAVIQFTFDISQHSPDYNIRREQVLRLELMIMHTIDFNMIQHLSWDRAMELLQPAMPSASLRDAGSDGGGAAALGQQQQQQQQQQQRLDVQLFQKIFGYVVQLPFHVKLSAVTLAECAVWFVWDSLEVLTEARARLLTSVDQQTLDGFAAHVLDYIAHWRRDEMRAVPKIAARVMELRSRVRMAYASNQPGGGDGSSVCTPTMMSAHHPQSGSAAVCPASGGSAIISPMPLFATTGRIRPRDPEYARTQFPSAPALSNRS